MTITASVNVDNPNTQSGIFQGTGTIRVRGTLTPGDSDRDGVGDQVTVWKSANNGKWVKWATTTADPKSGSYVSIAEVPGKVATHRFAATNGPNPANTDVKATPSKKVKVRRSKVAVQPLPNTCRTRKNVKVSGKVRPSVKGRQVRVQQRLGSNGPWKAVKPKKVTTNAKGNWKTHISGWPNSTQPIHVRAWLWEPATKKWVPAPKNRSFWRCG